MIPGISIISDNTGVEYFLMIMQSFLKFHAGETRKYLDSLNCEPNTAFKWVMQEIPPVLWILSIFSMPIVLGKEHLKTDYLELMEY